MYEKGMFKPLENVELKEGVKGKVRIEEEEELDEIYYEGKMFD